MARPRTLPEDNGALERLLARHTQTEVADMFGVSNQAVSKAIRDRKLSTPQRASYKQYIPWKIRMADQESYPHRMLRFYAMEQTGKPLTPKQAGQLAKFKRELDEAGQVIHYNPRHPSGQAWMRTPARPGIDKDYIRNPEVP